MKESETLLLAIILLSCKVASHNISENPYFQRYAAWPHCPKLVTSAFSDDQLLTIIKTQNGTFRFVDICIIIKVMTS